MTRRRARNPVLLALLVALAASAWADEYEDRLEPGRCLCHRGKGTYEYLRAPFARPEDPPRCGLLLSGGDCGNRPRPSGTRAACWGSSRAECFFKRHAWSWDLRCSACWSNTSCEACDEMVGGRDEQTRALLAERIQAERGTDADGTVVVVSPHFYVVTNLDGKLKLRTARGSYRILTAHEVAHLYAQRCEQAYDDFAHWFGPELVLPKPMAVYVVRTEGEARSIGKRYFGGEGIHMNYAFAYNNRIADGFSGNGFVVSLQEQHDDNAMHGFCRHQIGHILFSCWHITNGFEDHCPQWAWVGAAHFLERLLDIHDEYATFCYGEAGGGEGTGKRWEKRVRDMAARDLEPIETFFHKNSLSDFDFQDHLRAWSIMDRALREDRERWVRLLTMLRNAEDEGTAFKAAMDITPAEFHERWVGRLRGRRRSLGEVQGDTPDEEPGLAERRLLAGTREPALLAGRIRGLDRLVDVATARVVVDRLSENDDLVRETIHHLLLRTEDPTVRAWLREEGLRHTDPLARAGVARALGDLLDAEARETLEVLLDDRHWLVRANAATALARIGNVASRPLLLAALDEKDPKAWIAIADAFATWDGLSEEATPVLASRLGDARWQVRLTACQALARVGTASAIDALIERFGEEDGRLHRELHAALRAVTHDDLGPDAGTWRRWWKDQKAQWGGLPPEPEAPAHNPADDRYAQPGEGDEPPPHYYGKRFFSRSICFVLDTSGSMELNMEIPPEAAPLLGDIPTSGTRAAIAISALSDALGRLDPRTRVRLVFFDGDVRLWKDQLVPATPSNIDAMRSAIRHVAFEGETNFHGALKAALGLHERSSLDPRLDDVPDTVFFLTDGRPTRGEIQPMPELISWMENVNRFSKVQLHVIALGELNVDVPKLRELAAAGSGALIHVPEK